VRTATTRISLIPIACLVSCQLMAAERPDVVVIMTDDMGYSDLGCFGGEIRTPNLDRLADGGLRFTSFYSENMCWVSRAAMLTGIYHRTALKDKSLHPRCVTLPEALRDSGYQTRMSGKWHLAGPDHATVYPIDRGFEHWYGMLGGAASFFAPFSLTRDRANVESEYNSPNYYLTQAISDNAVTYINEVDKDKPLFLYVAYTAAHWPLHALPDDIAAYHGKYSTGWDKLREERLKRMKQLGVVPKDIRMSPRHPHVPAWKDEKNQVWQQRRMEVYAAQITSMDRGIGQIVAALKRRGRFENTLILYTIDNGGCHVEYTPDRKGTYLPKMTRDGRPMIPGNLPEVMPGPENTYQSYGYGWANASNTPFRLFKQFDHEGGIHTPMIAHWPTGIKNRGGIVQQVSHLIDVMPTVLDATETTVRGTIGGKERLSMDGTSLLPAMVGSPTTNRTLFFDHNKGRAVRRGNWKLVTAKKKTDPVAWELYDLARDPNELNNLAAEMPIKVDKLSRLWEEWSQRQKQRNKS
jgi:arylsulfatase A-like enzyme